LKKLLEDYKKNEETLKERIKKMEEENSKKIIELTTINQQFKEVINKKRK